MFDLLDSNLELVLIPRFLSLLSFRFNLIHLRLFSLTVAPIRPESASINNTLEVSSNDFSVFS